MSGSCEGVERVHDRVPDALVLEGGVDDDVDGEAVHAAVADEATHSDGEVVVDGADGGEASVERPFAVLEWRRRPADSTTQLDEFSGGRSSFDDLHDRIIALLALIRSSLPPRRTVWLRTPASVRVGRCCLRVGVVFVSGGRRSRFVVMLCV
jgi:hypothetical protein